MKIIKHENFTIELPDDFKPKPLPGRDKWLKALRSGDYTQEKYKLKQFTDDGTTYCCLGVLCEIQKRPQDISNEDLALFDNLNATLSWHNPAHAMLGTCGLFPSQVRITIGYCSEFLSLASCNDAGFTFDEIATIIETLWTNADN